MVLDSSGRAWRFDGSTWRRAGSPLLGDAAAYLAPSLRCTGSTFCMAISAGGRWSRWTGSGWTSRASLPSGLVGREVLFDCASSLFCVAVVDAGASARWQGSSWSIITGDSYGVSYRLLDLDCPSTAWCIGTQAYSNSSEPSVWTSTGGWVRGTPYGTDVYLGLVSCPSTSRCVITGNDAATWTVPAPTG